MAAEFFCSSSAFKEAPDAVAAYARRHRYAGVEWYLDQRRIPIAPEARARMFATMRVAGLNARFHAPAADVEIGHADPAIAAASLRYLLMYMEFLAEAAPTTLTVHVGSRSIPMELLSWDTTLEHLGQVASAGAARGVTVCLENLKRGWTSDPDTLMSMAEAAGSAITLDLGHAGASPFVQSGGTLEAFYATVSSRVANVHVYALETQDGRHLPLESLETHRGVLDAMVAEGRHPWVLELSSIEDLTTTQGTLQAYAAP